MITKGGYRDERAELLIELIEGALQAEGYKTIRMSDTEKHGTTAYDCIVVKDWKYGGGIFTLDIGNTFNECYAYLFEREGQK